MLLLLVFSFLAGIVTILSPCILPILPIVLSSSFGRGKLRPLGIVAGFILSFTFFTLFLTLLVKLFGIAADSLRYFSIVLILLLGFSMFSPTIQTLLEKVFSSFSRLAPRTENKNGILGGIVIGFSIGLLWTPCVGPILASVIALALTGSVTLDTFLITFAYSLGTAIPMLAIIYGGQKVLSKVPSLTRNTSKIQKIFGLIMILTALAIYFDCDRKFQNYIIQKFPSYGIGLTKFEENKFVTDQLKSLGGEANKDDMGKPMYTLNVKGPAAPELILGGKWINSGSQGEALQNLRGKVVLIDFWTYTCINCIRTLPYLKSWDEKYREMGLVIIGVHTPEFEFEKEFENVQNAVNDFGIKYPVMQDNNYATWRAYKNRYWPAKYLIDRDGVIRYTHFGEGDYDETEVFIQKLLNEIGTNTSNIPVSNPNYLIETKTPEIYLGYSRIDIRAFATNQMIVYDQKVSYVPKKDISNNQFALDGEWSIGQERAAPSSGSKLFLNFSAKDVYLVMRPKGDEAGTVKVLLNGKELTEQNTGDDAPGGIVRVNTDRLYELIHLKQSGNNLLQLEFLDDNIELYAFTFG